MSEELKIINPNKLETNVSIPGVSIGLQLGDIIRIKDDTNKILNNQIFFIVGQSHSLELLKDLGYKTFDTIIDETYDTIDHNGDRLEAVSQEVIKFLNRPIEQIREDYIRAIPVIEHNRNLMFSQSHDLSKRLQSIVDRYA